MRSVTVSTLENKLVILLKRVDENTQGIIVIYHECSENSKNLILSTAYFNCYENHTMVTVNIKPGCYHVAIFGVTEGYTVEESSAKVVCIDVRDSCKLISIYLSVYIALIIFIR